MCERPALARTDFAVRGDGREPVETISGECHAWRFRPHYHTGNENVRVLAGRARLHLPDGYCEVSAGDMPIIPAGVIHRFEPVDASGWAFVSHFVPADTADNHDAADLAAKAVALLAQRPTLRTDIATIALTCATSEGHLSRAFRRATGSSLHNFHVVLALHRAKALLRSDTPPAEAALLAGFNDQAHLNREFVRTFGMTPGTFRQAWANAA